MSNYAIIIQYFTKKDVDKMNYTALNKCQEMAVKAPLKPIMVVAGPGSGKTHVIIHRLAHMLEVYDCDPHNILVITFTKAAAQEMKQRFITRFGETPIQFGTFHAIFYRILRHANSYKYDLDNLISEEKKKKLIEDIYRSLQGEDEDFLDLFLNHFTLMKNQLIKPQYYNPDGLPKDIFLKVCMEYDAFKERQNLFDFDDMLVDCYYTLVNDANLLHYWQNKYRHILIDEFQDINLVQFEIIKLLSIEQKDIFIVGDDDQSIYCFRGAKPEFLISFKDYFEDCDKIVLNINYRSTPNILKASNALIGNNKARYPKEMETPNLPGCMPKIIHCKDPKEQADSLLKNVLAQKAAGIPFSEIAVIYRTNIEARPIVEVLLSANIPFTLRDSMLTLYDQWVTKDILAYLKLAQDFTSKEQAKRIINRPSRYISKAHLISAEKSNNNNLLMSLLALPELSEWQKDPIQQLIYHLQTLKNKPFKDSVHYIRKIIGYDKYILEYTNYRKIPSAGLMEILDEIEESIKNYDCVSEWEDALVTMANSIKEHSKNNPAYEGIILTTMHSAKGLEFESVYIIDAIEGVTPHHKSNSDTQLEEERRLFYVAMTRAKNTLTIYTPAYRYEKKCEPSLFLLEMQSLQSQDELQGKTIIHKHFGKGKIVEASKKSIKIKFESGIIKTIDPEFSFKKNLIKLEEE